MIGSLRQRHRLSMMAPAALLRGVGGIDFDQRPASFFRFAEQVRKEGRPCRIMNALRQTMIVNHAVDMQVFHTDDPICIDNLTAFLMGEVLPSPRNPLMDTCHGFAMLTPLGTSLRKFRMFALHLGK